MENLAKKAKVVNKVDIRPYEERQLDACTFKPASYSKLKQFTNVSRAEPGRSEATRPFCDSQVSYLALLTSRLIQ